MNLRPFLKKIKNLVFFRARVAEKIAKRVNVFAAKGIPMYLDAHGMPCAALQDGPTSHPVFVCTIPKSGTYLYADLLTRMGLVPLNWHIADWGLSDLRFASKQIARTAPEQLLYACPTHHLLNCIKPGQFVVGHFPFSQENAHLLHRFKVIFAYRNLRDTLVSFMRYMAKNGLGTAKSEGWASWPEGPEKLNRYLERHGSEFFDIVLPMKGWIEQPNVFAISYEQIVGDYGIPAQIDCIARLSSFLGLNNDSKIDDMLKGALGSDTITFSGSRTNREIYWSENAEKFFVEHGGTQMEEYLHQQVHRQAA